MSDSSKYINTYVDITVGTIHDLLNQVLQLKTEARIANDLVSERDQVISILQQEQENSRLVHEQADKANEQARSLENEVNSLRNKANNFDAMTNQFNDVKRDFINKSRELENVKKQLEEAQAKIKELQKIDRQLKREEKKSPIVITKPGINKETTPVAFPIKVEPKVIVKKPEPEVDDF